jgi:membrane protein YdbS with pleckstrin-like domain
MPYPRQLLNPGEEIAVDFNPHWWYFAEVGAAGFGVIILAFLVFQVDGDVGTGLHWLWGLLIVGWIFATGWRYLTWRTTHFVVTSDRLIVRSGVFARRGREIPLERINDITFHQTLFERLLGSGDLVVESAGTQGQQVFGDIPNPEFVQGEIYRQVEGNARRTAEYGRIDPAGIADALAQRPGPVDQQQPASLHAQSPPPPYPQSPPPPSTHQPTSAASVPDQLERLAQLRDKGVITQAEFESKKAELLGRI